MKSPELTDLAVRWLRRKYPDSHITTELSLGSWGVASVDVAAICSDQIVGVEIKGDGDSPSRLKLQGAMYGRCCRTMYLLPSPELHKRCQNHKPPEWFMLSPPGLDEQEYSRHHACRETGIVLRRYTGPNGDQMPRGEGLGLAPYSLADMIWSTEVTKFKYGLGRGAGFSLPKRKSACANYVASEFSVTAIEKGVCEVLRQRNWMGGKRVSYPVEQAA